MATEGLKGAAVSPNFERPSLRASEVNAAAAAAANGKLDGKAPGNVALTLER